MNRRTFVKLCGLSAGGLASGCFNRTSFLQRPPISHPNILFIYTDDQTFDAIGALGGYVQTPNIDTLAKKGVTFTHAYNQGAWQGAVCIASRTMLNTGRFLWNANAVESTLDQERDAGRLWSQYMKSGGYETYFAGKWHVRTDAQKLFDHTRHIRPGMARDHFDYTRDIHQGLSEEDNIIGYNRPVKGQPDPWKPWDKSQGGYWQDGKHWSEVYSDDGRDFLKQASQNQKPFFIYLASNAPHDPRQSPKEFVEQYPMDTIEVPDNFLPEYPYKDAMGCSAGLRDEALAPFPRTGYAVKKHRSEYYAIITHLDRQIGRILDTLEEEGLSENTYIFFTSDNGLAIGKHGLFGKQSMFEHSVRVPLIVAGPGIRHGKIETPVYLQDIMPTCLELAGVEKPDHVQFKSLLPLMQNKAEKSYNTIYGGYMELQRMILDGRHKLILYPTIQKVLLFDLANDPHEKTDISQDESMRPVIRKLFNDLLELQKQTGDPLDLKVIYPDLCQVSSVRDY